MPTEDAVKVQLIKLKNETPRRRKLQMFYYLKPVIGEDEIKTSNYLQAEFDRNSNSIIVNNFRNEDFKNIVFISSSEKINSYTGIKKEFLGNGGLKNPYGIQLDNLSDNLKLKESEIIAIQIEVELEALASKEISIILGASKSQIECKDLAYKYCNINNCIQEEEEVKKYWNKLLTSIQVNTPSDSLNILLNGWTMYQTIASRIIGRTGFYQSGGAYGFRDQLQDSMSAKYLNPKLTRNQIIMHSKHQFIEGDVEHWWHEDTQRGIRTRFSDDLLWLPYVVADYIKFTNDYSILNVETNYLAGKELEPGVNERYDIYYQSDINESVFKHCIKAIEKSLEFGKNGLPKIGSGDWNDGLSNVGIKGEGESVWLAFFLGTVLKNFIPICEYMERNNLTTERYSEKYTKIIEQLKKSVNSNAWDGRWFKRAFMDDGNELRKLTK